MGLEQLEILPTIGINVGNQPLFNNVTTKQKQILKFKKNTIFYK